MQWVALDFKTGYRLTAMPLQAHTGRTKVATVHGNTDTVTRLVDAINEHTTDSASVYYVNKGKTTNAIQRAGNPIPGGLNDLDGFTASISEKQVSCQEQNQRCNPEPAVQKDVNKNVSPMRSTHSVVAIVDIGTAKKSLLVPIEITAERTVNGEQMDVNTISSVYEKSVKSLVAEAIAQENAGDIGVYYAKKEALTLPAAGVQFPVRLQQSIASSSIVHRFSEKVNMKISVNIQSQQFKRWFGDWQNDPAHASKVVNADGTPKVVYHQTDADFTTDWVTRR